MKKILVLYLILFSFSSVYSQDLLKEIQQQTLIIDSLKKQVIKPLKDSLIELNSNRRFLVGQKNKIIDSLSRETRRLTKEKENCESIKAELNSTRIKLERDNLQTIVDSLEVMVKELNEKISEKTQEIEQEKRLGLVKAAQEKEKGKQEALDRVIQTYNKAFDALIKSSTLYTVQRDLQIVKVGNNNEVQQKLLNLEQYFLANQVLSETYNEQKVTTAKARTSNLEQTEYVKNLTKLLNEYELYNTGLQNTINEIILIDSQMIANDDYSKEKKQQNILYKLSWYFRNYLFRFTDYPYLSDIILEIMKEKQRDANTDISRFLDKLK